MSDPMIPVASVRESDFWAALKPLLDLLNTTPLHQFADAGITIRRDPDTLRMRVHFQHAVAEVPVAGITAAAWPIVEVTDGEHPEFDELAYDVDVIVEPTPGAPDPVHALWPGPFPKSTPARESGV